MRKKFTNVIKWITYFLPFVWLIARNYVPIMQFDNLDRQGVFFLFMMFGMCAALITFPKFEGVNMLLNGKPTDTKYIRNMKTLFFVFELIYLAWMVYSVITLNVVAIWTEGIAQIIFLISLTWYLWFSFGMSFLKYCDVKEYSEVE